MSNEQVVTSTEVCDTHEGCSNFFSFFLDSTIAKTVSILCLDFYVGVL